MTKRPGAQHAGVLGILNLRRRRLFIVPLALPRGVLARFSGHTMTRHALSPQLTPPPSGPAAAALLMKKSPTVKCTLRPPHGAAHEPRTTQKESHPYKQRQQRGYAMSGWPFPGGRAGARLLAARPALGALKPQTRRPAVPIGARRPDGGTAAVPGVPRPLANSERVRCSAINLPVHRRIVSCDVACARRPQRRLRGAAWHMQA